MIVMGTVCDIHILSSGYAYEKANRDGFLAVKILLKFIV
jgi:hypothetical protein